MKLQLKLILVTLIIVIIIGGAITITNLWKRKIPLISPIDLIENLPPLAQIFKQKSTKVTFAFLPYWNFKYINELNIRHLTHLAFFGIDLNNNGSLKKLTNPREVEPGWLKLNSQEYEQLSQQLKLINKKTILTITAFKQEQIESVLSSQENQDRAIEETVNLAKQMAFNGINIDFEYNGSPTPQLKNQYASFVKKMARQCKTVISACEISIDIYADTVLNNRLYDLQKVKDDVDHVIIMAYDFYRPSSSQAGPVSPLRGKCNDKDQIKCLDYDVLNSVSDITKIVPNSKTLLGIPFYGYLWQTVDDSFLSNSYPNSGGTVPLRKIFEQLNAPDVSSQSTLWAIQTMTPYSVFYSKNKVFQIHYESSQSLALKIDLVNQSNLAGIAIWALGYEQQGSPIWQTINQKLLTPSQQ